MIVVGDGATHPGRVRPQNEDAMLVDPAIGLFAVADGLGGHNAGEVASSLALQTIRSFIVRSREDPDHTWPFGLDSQLDFDANRLRTSIMLANRQIHAEASTREQYSGMGTTVAALLAGENCLALSSVGDSRIYVVSGGIECLTKDDTWVQVLLNQNPEMDPKSLESHPMRHVLTSMLGAQPDIEVHVECRTVQRKERFVLTTDGVHGALDDASIGRIVAGAPDTATAAERLVAEALERDGSDNLTAVVVEVSPKS